MPSINLRDELRSVFLGPVNHLLTQAGHAPAISRDLIVTEATRPEFGDFQLNQAMPLAKVLGRKPREIAEELVAAINHPELELSIAGPGFINIKLGDGFLLNTFARWQASDRYGVQLESEPQSVIVDYSSPNIAKEMHVGHLRSTIIGESIARILEWLGHRVERVNHLGDWGTQFGMLIRHLKDANATDNQANISDLVGFYKEAKKRFDEEDGFADKARQEVTKLQSGDAENLGHWEKLCQVSREAFREIYDLLNVDLIERGESFYNSMLPDMVQKLDEQKILTMSDGAACVFIEEIKNRDGEPLPLIVRKSDGGYTYDTTDLAALYYRLFEQKADRVIYVTDKGQSTHFKQVFAAGRMAGWIKNQNVQHVGFGLVLGEDKKKFKTRSGETVRLRDLLDEAVSRARTIVDEKNAALPEESKHNIARTIGIGAVKYADLSQNRESDYVFSYDKMLALQGNTAPYNIYAFVRIQSIKRKAAEEGLIVGQHSSFIKLSHPHERALIVHLLKFSLLFENLADDFGTHHLAEYLFELGQTFSRFHKECPVLQAESDDIRQSRLFLIDQVAGVLKTGLYLLGIDVLEQM